MSFRGIADVSMEETADVDAAFVVVVVEAEATLPAGVFTRD